MPPQPLGFPNCPNCQHVNAGPISVCVTCAHASIEAITANACAVCSQKQSPTTGRCPNALCSDPSRRIESIAAIAYLTGPLRSKIHRYKYLECFGWGPIFGRLLVGFLDRHRAAYSDVNLIVANPTWTSPDRLDRHTELVIEAASVEDQLGTWPWDDKSSRALIVTGAKPQSAGSSLVEKRAAAAAHRSLLRVPDPRLTAGKDIVVYDDVCTTAYQLDAVADCLLTDGKAARVRAVVLARTPWAH